MQVEHRLPGTRTHVIHRAISVLDAALAADLRGDQLAIADNFSSSGLASFNPAMCCLGMMSMCVGALGLMSSKANTLSSSYTFLAGIFPAMILQKRQFSSMRMMLA